MNSGALVFESFDSIVGGLLIAVTTLRYGAPLGCILVTFVLLIAARVAWEVTTVEHAVEFLRFVIPKVMIFGSALISSLVFVTSLTALMRWLLRRRANQRTIPFGAAVCVVCIVPAALVEAPLIHIGGLRAYNAPATAYAEDPWLFPRLLGVYVLV